MKNLLLLFTLCLPALLAAQMTYIPDYNFEEALIDLGYDTPPLNHSVPTKNIDTITYLNVYRKRIKDLTGIEDFIALTELKCVENALTSLDVSKNTALTYLDCSNNNLINLNVSNNTGLTKLYCNENNLTNLDVTKNSILEVFECQNNSLANMDVSKNTVLKEFQCQVNNISIIDVTKNISLSMLDCSENSLAILDVSKNNELRSLVCSTNVLMQLDIIKNLSLSFLYCSDNDLSSLDISHNLALFRFDATNNSNLYCIKVYDSIAATKRQSWWYKDDHAVWSEDCSLVSVDEETNPTNDITLSPNPANDYIEINNVILNEVKIRENVEAHPVLYVKLYDVLGIEQSPSVNFVDTSAGGGHVRVDVSSLSPGVYFVKVGERVSKFVKM